MRTARDTSLSFLAGVCRHYPPFVIYGTAVFGPPAFAGPPTTLRAHRRLVAGAHDVGGTGIPHRRKAA